MYDKTIAKLEDELEQAKGFLRFMAAYVASQPRRQIEIHDITMAQMNGKEQFTICHDEQTRTTTIGIKK